MKEETKTSNKTKNRISNRKKMYASIAAVLVVAALIAGLSYAWFYNRTDMATLMEIKPPSNISILGPGGKEMTSLDLNYTDEDKIGDQVTVRRVICVQSEVSVTNYQLEIVHTTNLKGLTFNLYPVLDNGSEKVTDGGIAYQYSKTKISGRYLNQNTTETGNYKYADKTKHDTNYGEYESVQSHAEPLYWLVNGSLSPTEKTENQVTIESKTYNRTYYVCEVTWTEKDKETDIFYILAKTV